MLAGYKKCGSCQACKRQPCGQCLICIQNASGGGCKLCARKFCEKLVDDNHCGNCSACYNMPRFGGTGNLKMGCKNRIDPPRKSSPVKPAQIVVKPNNDRQIDSPTVGNDGKKQLAMTPSGAQTVVEGGEKLAPSPMKDVQLPRLKLNAMTKDELKDFIPRLLKMVTGRDEVFHGRRSARPDWWPDEVPWSVSRSDWASVKHWTDSLRDIVRSCYRYLKQENMLYPQAPPTYPQAPPTYTPLQEIQGDPLYVNTGPFPSSPVKSRTFPNGLYLPFSTEIFICFFCEKEFLSKAKMRHHQKTCSQRPPELRKLSPAPAAETPLEPPQMSPKKSCQSHSTYPQLPVQDFFKKVDLVPIKTAEKLRQRKCNLEIDCKIDEFETLSPVSPVTPRTPKTLISQLSHDDSGIMARKRLSYSISIEHKDDKQDENEEKGKREDGSESDSDRESTETSVPKPKQLNLLSIPLSSLLGQRIRKHIHVDTFMSVVDNQESFCKTPVKNAFLDKLRKKVPAYPVVYKPRWIAGLHKENHKYKFTTTEVKEFICRFDTGLNCRSYRKLKEIKYARVVVEKTSTGTLLRWVSKGVLDKIMRKDQTKSNKLKSQHSTMCDFPSGPTLLAKNIDKLLGLKRRSSTGEKQGSLVGGSLSLSNCVSEEIELEVSNQKLTLYRSLLHEMSVHTPTVVVEDFSRSLNANKLMVKKISSDGTPKKTPSPLEKRKVLHTPVEKGLPGDDISELRNTLSTSGSKEMSVLRTMLMQNKQDRLCEETLERERKLKARAVTASPASPGHLCKLSLPSISGKKSTTMDLQKVECGLKFTKPPSSPMLRSSSQQQVADDKSNSPRTPATRSSGLLVGADNKSPHDDELSIISLSSEGESYNSECCLNCSSRKKHSCSVGQSSGQSPCSMGHSSGQSPKGKAELTSMEGQDQNQNKTSDLLLPLLVKVDESADILSPGLYEIPSPVSMTTESPNSPSVCCPTETSTPVTRMAVATPVKSPSQGNDKKLSLDKQSCSDKQTVPSNHLVEENKYCKSWPDAPLAVTTRAKSLTPSNSPQKRSLRACSSLTNTPVKLFSSGAHTKQVNTKTNLQQFKSSSQSNNPYSLKSGNFITFLDSKGCYPEKPDKEISLSRNKLLRSSSSSVSSSEATVRKSKRLASSPLEGSPNNKLRKVL